MSSSTTTRRSRLSDGALRGPSRSAPRRAPAEAFAEAFTEPTAFFEPEARAVAREAVLRPPTREPLRLDFALAEADVGVRPVFRATDRAGARRFRAGLAAFFAVRLDDLALVRAAFRGRAALRARPAVLRPAAAFFLPAEDLAAFRLAIATSFLNGPSARFSRTA
jgi:hypothetical protein